MAEAVQMILSLIPVELAKKYLAQKWPPLPLRQYQIIADHSYKVTALDIPYIIELANQETLPVSIRDEMYLILQNVIPQFGNISVSDEQIV